MKLKDLLEVLDVCDIEITDEKGNLLVDNCYFKDVYPYLKNKVTNITNKGYETIYITIAVGGNE